MPVDPSENLAPARDDRLNTPIREGTHRVDGVEILGVCHRDHDVACRERERETDVPPRERRREHLQRVGFNPDVVDPDAPHAE